MNDDGGPPSTTQLRYPMPVPIQWDLRPDPTAVAANGNGEALWRFTIAVPSGTCTTFWLPEGLHALRDTITTRVSGLHVARDIPPDERGPRPL